MKFCRMAALSFLMVFSVLAQEAGQGNPPAEWAEPIELAGVPNLHKVSDSLYRSAQPTKEGMKNLKTLGIKTIFNLRAIHSDRNEIGKTDLEYVHISMKPWHAEKEDIIKFLKVVTDPNRHPILLHCQHGADRTGTMVAVYRIVVQGWTKQEAVREMIEGGYGFHDIWRNLARWIYRADFEAIKKELTDKKLRTRKH